MRLRPFLCRHQKFSVRLSTAKAASLMASLNVGWALQRRAMSSLLAFISMASTAWAISSLACGPTMCTPRISSVPASASILTMPAVSPNARARPLARKGKTPARYPMPSALSCCSLRPPPAPSGWVEMTHPPLPTPPHPPSPPTPSPAAPPPSAGRRGFARAGHAQRAAPVQRRAHGLGVQALGVGHPAYGHDELVHIQRLRLALGVGIGNVHRLRPLLADRDLADLRAQFDRQALLVERLFRLFGDLLVDRAQKSRQAFEDGDL